MQDFGLINWDGLKFIPADVYYFIQTTIPKLGFDKIEQLQLPEITAIDKQLEIIAFYNKSIAQKQKNEAEATNYSQVLMIIY